MSDSRGRLRLTLAGTLRRFRGVGKHPELAIIMLVTFVLYAVYALSRHAQYLTAGYDLGIFDQAVRSYAHFSAPMVPLKGDNFNLLGDHFHPILVLLAPLYWIWDDPRTLLLAQAGLVTISIITVWGFMARRLSSRWLLSALAITYVLSWPLQRLIDSDFHEIAFAVPLLAWAIDALDRRDDWVLFLTALPLLLVREDMGMVVAMLGVVRFIVVHRSKGGPRNWRVPTVMIASGVIGFVLVTKIALPSLSPSGRFAYWSYGALGGDPIEALGFMVKHPIATTKLFFLLPVKTVTLLFLFVPLLLLPLRSWLSLITLPLLAQRFLSDRVHLWSTEHHYSAPLNVILFLAAIEVLGTLPKRWKRRLAWILVAAHLLAAGGGYVMGTTQTMFKSIPHPLIRLDWDAWQVSEHLRDQRAAVASIPANTCLEVDDRLAAHLTRTNRVTLPTLTATTSDFIVLDLTQKEVGFPLPSPQVVEAQALAKGYRLVNHLGAIIVLERPGYSCPSAQCSSQGKP